MGTYTLIKHQCFPLPNSEIGLQGKKLFGKTLGRKTPPIGEGPILVRDYPKGL